MERRRVAANPDYLPWEGVTVRDRRNRRRHRRCRVAEAFVQKNKKKKKTTREVS